MYIGTDDDEGSEKDVGMSRYLGLTVGGLQIGINLWATGLICIQTWYVSFQAHLDIVCDHATRPVGSTGKLYDPCLAWELLHSKQREFFSSWSSLGHFICAFGYVLI